MNKTEIGTISGGFATVFLGNVNLFVGIATGIVTILCLVPGGITKWRNLIYDYRKQQTRTGDYSIFAFARYCLGGLQHKPDKTEESRASIEFTD